MRVQLYSITANEVGWSWCFIEVVSVQLFVAGVLSLLVTTSLLVCHLFVHIIFVLDHVECFQPHNNVQSILEGLCWRRTYLVVKMHFYTVNLLVEVQYM